MAVLDKLLSRSDINYQKYRRDLETTGNIANGINSSSMYDYGQSIAPNKSVNPVVQSVGTLPNQSIAPPIKNINSNTTPAPVVSTPKLSPFNVTVSKGNDVRQIQESQLPTFLKAGFVVGTNTPTETTVKIPTELPSTPETFKREDTTPTYTPSTYSSPEQQTIDEAEIRRKEEERIAEQIKAIEGVYAGEISKARQAGQERVQQRTAISTVRGGAGSDFASAEKDVVEKANLDFENAIIAEREAQIAAIRSKGGANAQALIEAAYKNAQTKKEMADKYIADEKAKFADAETIASKLSQSGGVYETLDPATRGLLEKYYGSIENAKKVFTELGKEEEPEQTKGITIGNNIVNPVTGEIIYEGTPEEVKSQVIGSDSTGYFEKQSDGTWKQIVNQVAPEEKLVKINGEDYVKNADGSYSKPELPQASTTEKVEKANSVITKIDDLLSNDDWRAGVGPISANLPDWASAKRNTAIANIESLVSSIALENLSLLKGPMSDKDIQFIKDASAGLRTNMSEEGFKAQLEKIKNKFVEIRDKASTSSTTRMIGPDGLIYNVPNDQVEAFKADGGQSFNTVGGDTEKATVAKKAVEKASAVVDNTPGGQCGTFVRKVAGIRVGNSYESKLAKMDPSIKYPEPGMVFITPYSWTGHIGVILDVKDGIATVKHSNYDNTEKVSTDQIPVSKMTGFAYPNLT